MAVSGADRRSVREAEVRRLFGAEADAALDLLELADLAWHDCFGEVAPPDAVVADMLSCSQGDLPTLARAARLGVVDARDLRLWADDVRGPQMSGTVPRIREQRPWPVRYEVRLRVSDGQVRRHRVLTWLGPEKAIALVVGHHRDRRGEERVADAEVDEVGPAPRSADGTVAVGDDLHDRMEF